MSIPRIPFKPFVMPALLLLPVLPAHAIQSLDPVTVRPAQQEGLQQAPSAGSRLGLSIQNTPASVDVISRERIDARGDTTVNEATARAPGFSSLAHPGNSGSDLSVRGFTGSSSVMHLYDGVRQYGGLGVSYPFHAWAVERIEVLRGPASVIDGDGAIGGVVNVVPRKPRQGAIRHEIRAGIGNRGQRSLDFDSSGSISERLAYRLDASAERGDGWVDRGKHSSQGLTGALQWQFLPRWQLQLSHAEGRRKPMRYFGVPLIDGKPLEALRRTNYNVHDARITFRDHWSELTLQGSPSDNIAVRSRLYHIRSNRLWFDAENYTWDAARQQIRLAGDTAIRHHQKQTGNTTDVTFDGKLLGMDNTISAGFDLNHSSLQHDNNTYSGNPRYVSLLSPETGFFDSDLPFIPRYRNTADQYALFVEDRLAVTGQLSLVAGLRHDRVRIRRDDLITGSRAFSRTWNSTGHRLGAVYALTPTLSVYAQHSRAADPSTAPLMMSASGAKADMTIGRQIEVGIKQSLPQQRGEWTLAAYNITKHNLQSRDPANPENSIQVGKQSSRGIEGTLSLALSSTLRLDADATVLRARYDDFNDAVDGVIVSRSGNTPPDVPERLANLWLSWQMLPQWTLSGGARHVGKRYGNRANDLTLPAYTTADLALTWRPSDATTLALHGYNIFNRHYYSTVYYNEKQWFVGESRRVLFTIDHRF